MTKKNKIKIFRIILILCLSFLIEFLLFNYTAVRSSLTGNEQEVSFTTQMNQKENNYQYTIEIQNMEDLDTVITSLNLNYAKDYHKILHYEVYMASQGDDTIYKLRDKYQVAGLENNDIQMDSHTKAIYLRLVITSPVEIQIAKITINHPNYHFSGIRILIIFFLLYLLALAKQGKLSRELYQKNSRTQKIFMVSLLFVILIEITTFVLLENHYFNGLPSQNIIQNQEQNLQTEALLSGSVNWLVKPSEQLVQLEDPYNPGLRNKNDVGFRYDTAYYKGHYTCYFGIAPILTWILPIRAIFSGYLPLSFDTLFFVLLTIVLLYLVYQKLVNRYLKEIRFFHYVLGYLTILFGSSLCLLLRGQKYDLVCACGIFFFLLATYLLIDIEQKEKWVKTKLTIAGIATGLVVLSKPSFILYYLLIGFWILLYWKDKTKSTKVKISQMVCFLLPLGLLAVFQMGYNLLRFENPLEFGAKYQLTSFNMENEMRVTFGKLLEGMGKYLFTFPHIQIFSFPFVIPNIDKNVMALNELCYQNKLTGLMAIPIAWIFALWGCWKKETKKEQEFCYWIRINLLVVLAFIVLNTCMAGICDAYSIEMKVIFVMAATLLGLKLVEKGTDKKMTQRIFVGLCIATLCLMVPLSLSTEGNWFMDTTKETTVYLKNYFEFWN